MRQRVTPGILMDPDAVTYAARGRWFVLAISIFRLACRSEA